MPHPDAPGSGRLRLGLGANRRQFGLLVLVNAFVGGMVGQERVLLPILAEQEFQLAARAAILSFIVLFGITKAATNLVAGHLADARGRKTILVAGWLLGAPVPFLLMWAPAWEWILVANALLGVHQGLCWSTTVIMKIDLAGPGRRGLAMGLNEFAGYLAVAAAAWATSAIAAAHGPRPAPFLLGIACVAAGLGLSLFAVRETQFHTHLEADLAPQASSAPVSRREIFVRTSFRDRTLSAVCQAGLVNNLNDGMAWGLLPLLFAAGGLPLGRIGFLAALYPALWGVGQLATGPLSDRIGRKGLVVWGMWTQAAGIALVARSSAFAAMAAGSVLLGLGTAMVYPTLLAAIGDVAHPRWRAASIGVYRFWRDLGYAVGALASGVLADRFGLRAAVAGVALLTLASGIVAAVRMEEKGHRAGPQGARRDAG
jgi:MFS family permease